MEEPSCPVDARIGGKGEWRAFVEDLFAAHRCFREELSLGEEEEGHRIRSGGAVLDCRAQRVWSRGRWNALTPLEFRMLHLLMSHPGVPYLPKELVSRVWGYGEEGRSDPPLRWHIKNLREKIEPDPLHPRLLRTLPRRGYLFDPGTSGGDSFCPPEEKAPPVRDEGSRGGLPSGWAEFLGSLSEGFPGALGVTLQGKVLWWNAQAEHLLGTPRGEILGRELLPFLRGDRRFFWRSGRSWSRGADGEEDWRFVLEVRRPPGETVRVEGVFAGRVFGGVFFGTWSFAPLAAEGEEERLRRALGQSEGILRAASRVQKMTAWVFSPLRETFSLPGGLPPSLETGLSGSLEVSLSCFLSRWVVPGDREPLRGFLLDPAEGDASLRIHLQSESGRAFPALFHAVGLPGVDPEEEFRRCGVLVEAEGPEGEENEAGHRYRRLAGWALHCLDLPRKRSLRAGVRVLEWAGRSLGADRGGLFRCVPETGCIERIHAWGRGWGDGPRRRLPPPVSREWMWRLLWEETVVLGPADRALVEVCFGGGLDAGSWLVLPLQVVGVPWGVQLYGWESAGRRFSPEERGVLRFATELAGKMAGRGMGRVPEET